MVLVGVISEANKFNTLLDFVQNNMNKSDITLININNKNIDNIKNIKFDSIVLIDYIENIINEMKKLNMIHDNLNYLILNSDIEIKNMIFNNIKTHIITFGLNHKSTVTFSSINDEMMLISVQRDFENKKGKVVEVGEYKFFMGKEKNKYLYETLVTFIMKKIYLFEK